MIQRLRPLSRVEVRSIDIRASEDLGLPTLVLMENAGRGAAKWLAERLKPRSQVVVACGPGSNGGDGAVVARHLDGMGLEVRVVWFVNESRVRGDAAVQRRILDRAAIEQIHLDDPSPDSLDGLWNGAHWLVDGLFGTGLLRPIEGRLAAVVESMNRSNVPILALDLPSGLDPDLGKPSGATIRAKATVTFVAPKIGFLYPTAREYLGEVTVVDIGVPHVILAPYLI